MYFYICQGTMYYQTVQYAVIGSIHNVKQQYIGTASYQTSSKPGKATHVV